ncbi:MAG: response regulator [Planctomycetes bacterium]|nr:response regulator [Planctomycetota bacterium]
MTVVSTGKFSRFLGFTLVGFMVVALVIAVSVLYDTVNVAMTREFQNQLLADQSEVSVILSERINEVESRLKEMSFNNLIRVNLMLEMEDPLKDFLANHYPYEEGARYFVRDDSGKVISGKPIPSIEKIVEVMDKGLEDDNGERQLYRIDNHDYYIFTAPLRRQADNLGTAVAIYNLAEDVKFWNRFYTNRQADLIMTDGKLMVNLFDHQRFPVPEPVSEWIKAGANGSYEDKFSQHFIMQLKSYPNLFYSVSTAPFYAKKADLVERLVVMSAVILLLSIFVSLYIARKVSQPLDDMANQAAIIASKPDNSSLNISGIKHEEFRKLAEAFNNVLFSLRETESRFRIMLNDIPSIAVQGLSQEGTINYWNKASENLCGYSAEEALGKNMFELVAMPDHRERAKIFVWNICESGIIPEPIEADFLTKDGTAIPVLINHMLVTVPNRPPQVYVFAVDLRGRKQLEAELLHSEKMQAIGQLAGGIAHDFNNQLGSIMGFADLIRDQLKVKELELYEYADMVVQASARASELTRQLLAFARKGKYRSEPVNIHRMIGEVISLLDHTIDKRIKLRQHLDANPPMVIGDPIQLQNALLNLGINARDAMEGGGSLTFETTNVTISPKFETDSEGKLSPGEYIKIKVIDTGMGMSEEVKRRAFEPFFTTKESGKGTGMGLAAVYGTVRNHHGIINITSTPGKGTTMEIYLPISDAREMEEKKAVGVIPMAQNNETILVVDDDDAVRRMACEILKSLKYKVIPCENGIRGVEEFAANKDIISCVLLDLVMPEMSGREAFYKIQEIDPEVRVIIASGYSLDAENRQLLERGAVAFLSKPFQITDMAFTMAKAIKK